ncbi:MAG: hypothetical protein KF762_12450 [Acidobacteria bacterium]|nr:hypothetical protein [Acidobacteriota bacterium]
MAQIAEPVHPKLHKRYKNAPDEKIKKAFAEASNIEKQIMNLIAKHEKRFVLENVSTPHLIYDLTPGHPGRTYTSFAWRRNGTGLRIAVELEFNKEETVRSFRLGLEGISLGEFFEAPGIGGEAVLVKNVEFNKKMTNVGLHFVKGRAMVSVYLSNHQRSREENEKELMEIVRLIEPLIIARPDFNDP